VSFVGMVRREQSGTYSGARQVAPAPRGAQACNGGAPAVAFMRQARRRALRPRRRSSSPQRYGGGVQQAKAARFHASARIKGRRVFATVGEASMRGAYAVQPKAGVGNQRALNGIPRGVLHNRQECGSAYRRRSGKYKRQAV